MGTRKKSLTQAEKEYMRGMRDAYKFALQQIRYDLKMEDFSSDDILSYLKLKLYRCRLYLKTDGHNDGT